MQKIFVERLPIPKITATQATSVHPHSGQHPASQSGQSGGEH